MNAPKPSLVEKSPELPDFDVIYDPTANRITIRQCHARAVMWWNGHQPEIAALMGGLQAESGGKMSVSLLKEVQAQLARLVAETGWTPARVGLRTGIIATRDPAGVAALARRGLEQALANIH